MRDSVFYRRLFCYYLKTIFEMTAKLMKLFGQTFRRNLVLLFILAALSASAAIAQSNNIKLSLDATDAAKNILHVRETMPAVAGNFALFYPKWIPGEHAPDAPLNDLVNLFITADGKPLAWQRDDVEMFAFLVNVPAGAKEIEISFDDVSQPGTVATANLARIKWNRVILYPRGVKSDDIQVTASIKLPGGWKYATALPVDKETTAAVDFKPVNLTTFIDSPAIIGKYFAKIPLSNDGGVLTEMDIAAETADALKYKSETLQGWKNLVVQANQMFGAHHYNSYKFLLTLSDNGGDEGLEHHESSEDGTGEKALSDQHELLDLGDLLGHEYTHSWNGKYRRPYNLTTPDFEQPMHGELLWVYEGLTQYLGRVLPTRSGLWSDEMFRESVADTAAQMDFQTGRRWRPLVDTARTVQFTYGSPRAWMNERRRVDYYYEGSLIWMEADVLIREKSGGKLSLDDFLRKFHGGQSGAPKVVTYNLDEIVQTLNAVVPFDWKTFFIERVYTAQRNAPLGGITNGGWKIIYNDTPNLQGEVDERRGETANLMYSIGIMVNEEGVVMDINPDLAGAKAGLAPGMTVKKVNDEEFSLDNLRKAVAATKNDKSTIKLDVENGSVSNTLTINYKGGDKFPHLVRDPTKTDYLSGITKPLSNLVGGFVSGEPQSFIFSGGAGRRNNRTADVVDQPANVTNVLLSQNEITSNCPANSNICANNKRTIDVSTEAVDPENAVLSYYYTVSGGKIIGQGAKLVWDLSDVKPGTYMITVGVDDGCGVCGKTITKEVKVVECPGCK
jgi:predicted metalloprotease with PDZ domain